MSEVVQAPPGFIQFPLYEGFLGLSGPYFYREPEGNVYSYGFQSDERHANPHNVLSGPALITFADTCFGHVVVHASKRMCATIALHTEFIRGVPYGGWIDLHARVKRITKTIAYVDGDVTCAGELVLTATALWRLFDGPPVPGEFRDPSAQASGGR